MSLYLSALMRRIFIYTFRYVSLTQRDIPVCGIVSLQSGIRHVILIINTPYFVMSLHYIRT